MPNDFEDPPHFEPDAELDDLAKRVIGAAIEAHRGTGAGLDEATYEEALAIEVGLRGIPFERQVVFPVLYKGHQIGRRRIDFVVGGRLVIELKAVEDFSKVHYAQIRTYLRITGLTPGLLFNFNTAVLKDGMKRVVCA